MALKFFPVGKDPYEHSRTFLLDAIPNDSEIKRRKRAIDQTWEDVIQLAQVLNGDQDSLHSSRWVTTFVSVALN